MDTETVGVSAGAIVVVVVVGGEDNNDDCSGGGGRVFICDVGCRCDTTAPRMGTCEGSKLRYSPRSIVSFSSLGEDTGQVCDTSTMAATGILSDEEQGVTAAARMHDASVA